MIYPNDISAVVIATIALVQALFIAVLLHHIRKAEQIIKRQRAELAQNSIALFQEHAESFNEIDAINQRHLDQIHAAFARAGMEAQKVAETINNNLRNND